MDDWQIKQTLTSIYDALAPAYERAVVPVLRPIAKRMLQLIDLRPGWQVLDAGTGTGLVALMGAPRVGKSGKMIGIDASEQMLEIARGKAAQFGFTQCEFHVGDLEALELPDAQLNAVLSQFVIHHTDPSKSLREFHRVLMPGGTLVVHEWADAPNAPNKVAFGVLSKYRAAEACGALAAARAQAARAHDFRSNAARPQPITELVEAAGFSSVEARLESHAVHVANVDVLIDLVTAAPLLHAEMNELSNETLAAFLDEAREAQRVFKTASGYAWTFNVLALVAHK
jgi:ubiquinone/menaquinone biosynthesis C-methylase UbiE